MSIFTSLLFPTSPSLFVTAMSVISFTSLANAGFSEIRGTHLEYSKFWDSNPNKKEKTTLSSRAGMLLLYTPAFVAAAASFFVPGVVVGARAELVSLSLAIHFFKRVFEVSFIHQYSGKMMLDTAIPITSSYFISTVTMIYAQYLTQRIAEPTINLTNAGIVIFLIGITGNFYHHYLLSKLREKDDKTYKIPTGGLFGQAICAHYLFEILGFVGISFISQTVYSVSFTLGTMLYLMGRSYATRRWYLSKFEDFPANVKALIPYIF